MHHSQCAENQLNSCTHFQDTANLGSRELNKWSRPFLTTGTQKSVKQLLAFLNFRLPRTSYRFLAPCQNLEKTNNTIPKNVQTGRSTDRRMEERTEGPKSFISQFLWGIETWNFAQLLLPKAHIKLQKIRYLSLRL